MLVWRPLSSSRSSRKSYPYLSWLGLATLIFLWMPLLAACGSSNTPPKPTVSALDNDFSPKQLQINVGQTVTWTNNGKTIHTVTADDNSFDSGNLDVGKTFTHTFTKPGRYPYYCQLHGGPGGIGMAGLVIVGNSSSTGAFASIQQPAKIEL